MLEVAVIGLKYKIGGWKLVHYIGICFDSLKLKTDNFKEEMSEMY